MNIAQVLKGFNKANSQGQKITELRQHYLEQVNEFRNQIVQCNAELQKAKDAKEKDAIQERATRIQRKIEDLDKQAQRELTELSTKAIIKVRDEIREVIGEVARDNDLDVIEIFPDATVIDEQQNSAAAQLQLQTPAAYPIYLKPECNYTDEVLKRLNKKFPNTVSKPSN